MLLRALKAGQEIDTEHLAGWGAIVRLEPSQVARTVRRVSQGELDVKGVREMYA